MKKQPVYANLDASEGIFFNRELEKVKARSYDVLFPELTSFDNFDVSTEAGYAAETITYRQFTETGVAKFISDYAQDLPRVDVSGQEFTSMVRGIAEAYGYSIQEIRRAQSTGMPLAQRKANAARRANDRKVNEAAYYGDVAHNIVGFFYIANATKGALTTGDWLNASRTADQIIADVNTLLSGIKTTTNGVEYANTVLIPVAEYAKIATMPRSATTDTTVLEFLQKVWKGVEFKECVEAGLLPRHPVTGATAATKVIAAYHKSPDKLTMEIPQPFEQFAAQERGLEYVVPCHSRFGGVISYYPLSISIGVL